jgi:site-specific recombinase XerD
MTTGTALSPLNPAGLPAVPEADLAAAVAYAKADKAESTRRAYKGDYAAFCAWCSDRGVAPLPATAETVAAFLAFEAGRGVKSSTIGRRVAAILYAHKLAGHESPTSSEAVRATVRGIRRSVGAAPVRKAPATADKMCAISAAMPNGLIGHRDRALLLLGFAGAFRRSELVALDVADIQECEAGLRVHIGKSKTDQESKGVTIAIVPGAVACPVKAVKAWLEVAAITDGPVFRSIAKGERVSAVRLSDKSVADIVKRHVSRLGLDPAAFGGHSLRAGFLTSAAARGASVFKMMDVSRHKSVDTLRGYVRDAELFRDHAGAGLL